RPLRRRACLAPRGQELRLDRRGTRDDGRRGSGVIVTSLRGRTALVTGGGSGLGAAIAAALHEAGSEVIVVGRDEAKLTSVVERLGDRARLATCDVADAASVEALREALDGTEISIL